MRRTRQSARIAGSLLLALAMAGCHSEPEPPPLGISGPRSGGLVFVREVEGRADLARARLDDGVVALVASTPGREERWPYWSEAAGLVVFQARDYAARPITDLVFWNPETGGEATLGKTPRRDERWPTWSPVDPRLVYAFKQAPNPAGLMSYDVRTRQSAELGVVPFPGFYLRPAFSPDGRRLVAQRRPTPRFEMDLWLLEPGQPARRLTGKPGAVDIKARFLPGGESIVFTRRAGRGQPGELLLLDLASGAAQPIASHPEADDHSSWPSPTRAELSFISDRDGSPDVFLYDLETGDIRNLTRTPGIDEGAPIWSPDGERLVVLQKASAGSDDPHHLVVIDRQGRVTFRTQGMMADWMPAWPKRVPGGGGR